MNLTVKKLVRTIWENEWGGKAIFSHGTPAARGIAVFFNKTLFPQITNILTDEEGRKIIFDLQQNNQIATIAAIYAPNQDTPKFFQNLEQDLRNRSEQKIIIGDFNLTMSVDMDREGTYCNNNKSKQVIEDLMEEYCLSELWRDRNPEAREFSWFKRGDIQKASRIDFALISKGLDQMTKEIMYIASLQTDHRAVYLSLDFNKHERGSGYWKMNTKFLQDQTFVRKMNNEIKTTLDSASNKEPIREVGNIKTQN